MQFMSLTMWLAGLYTDNETDTNNDDDGQSMIVQGSLVDEPNKPKSTGEGHMYIILFHQ